MNWVRILKEKITELFKGKQKKRIETAAIVIIIGVIIIIAGSSFFDNPEKNDTSPIKEESTMVTEVSKSMDGEVGGESEKKIERVLSQIQGAGKVTVLITYSSGKELVPASDLKKTENDTNEKDNGGGTRSIKGSDYEKKVAYEEVQGGIKRPIILKEINPKIEGVVVVAEGAKDPKVRESLSSAVRVLTGVPAHKIQVFEGNR